MTNFAHLEKSQPIPTGKWKSPKDLDEEKQRKECDRGPMCHSTCWHHFHNQLIVFLSSFVILGKLTIIFLILLYLKWYVVLMNVCEWHFWYFCWFLIVEIWINWERFRHSRDSLTVWWSIIIWAWYQIRISVISLNEDILQTSS